VVDLFWPAAVGKPDSHTLFSAGTKAYKQNSGLDSNKDGSVSKCEAAAGSEATNFRIELIGLFLPTQP